MDRGIWELLDHPHQNILGVLGQGVSKSVEEALLGEAVTDSVTS